MEKIKYYPDALHEIYQKMVTELSEGLPAQKTIFHKNGKDWEFETQLILPVSTRLKKKDRIGLCVEGDDVYLALWGPHDEISEHKIISESREPSLLISVFLITPSDIQKSQGMIKKWTCKIDPTKNLKPWDTVLPRSLEIQAEMTKRLGFQQKEYLAYKYKDRSLSKTR